MTKVTYCVFYKTKAMQFPILLAVYDREDLALAHEPKSEFIYMQAWRTNTVHKEGPEVKLNAKV